MKDEDIWLLQFGSRWVDWWELANEDGSSISELSERMHEAGKLESDRSMLRVRLKPKE